MPRRDLTVVYVPIDTLKPFAQNAMAPGEEDWQKLEAVLMAFNPASKADKSKDGRLDG